MTPAVAAVRRAGHALERGGARSWTLEEVRQHLLVSGRPLAKTTIAEALGADARDPKGVVRRVRPGVYRVRTKARLAAEPVVPAGRRAEACDQLWLVARELCSEGPASRAALVAGLQERGVDYSSRAVSYGLARLVADGMLRRPVAGKYQVTATAGEPPGRHDAVMIVERADR